MQRTQSQLGEDKSKYKIEREGQPLPKSQLGVQEIENRQAENEEEEAVFHSNFSLLQIHNIVNGTNETEEGAPFSDYPFSIKSSSQYQRRKINPQLAGYSRY